MKRFYFYLLSIIALISCSKDIISNDGDNYSPKFYTIINDTLKVNWNTNDKISVFTSTDNQMYQFDGKSSDSEASFSKVGLEKSSTGTPLSVDANYAVYPYSAETAISNNGTLSFNLPQTQAYATNGMGINSNPMVAITENKNDTYLSFKNICGYLKVNLYGDNITAKSIRLEGKSNERISGKVNISISYGKEPVISFAKDASYAITLDCGDGVKIGESVSEATEFWFAVPPITFENGFTLFIEDINGNKYTNSTENKIEIKRTGTSNMTLTKVEQLMEYCYNFLEEDLHGWENGIHFYDDKNSLYIVSKTEIAENRNIFVMNEFSSENIDDALIFCFESGQIQDVFINGYQFNAHTRDNNILFLAYDPQGANVDSFEVPYEESEELYSAPYNPTRGGIEHYRIVNLRKLLAKAGKIIYDVTGMALNLEEGKYADILRDLILGKFANNISKKALPQIVTVEAIKQYIDRLYENNKNWFLGNSNIEISSIKRTSLTTISVQGQIANISSIPTSRIVVYNGVQGFTDNIVMYGVAEGKSGQPGLYLHDSCSNLKMVSETEFICTLNVSFEPGQTFYFRPFLVPEVKVPNSNDILPDVGTCIRYGSRKSYTDVTPSCSTGQCTETTENSAIVKCTYENTIDGCECGVYISSNNETRKITANSTDGEQTINISGLKPATTYNYWAYININGEPINGQPKSFTTDSEPIPDLSGTWTFTQECLATNPYQLTLKLDDSGKDWVVYRGSYGAVAIYFNVNSNRTCSVSVISSYGYNWYCNNGKMNASFTYASGDSHSHWMGVVDKPWSLSKN